MNLCRRGMSIRCPMKSGGFEISRDTEKGFWTAGLRFSCVKLHFRKNLEIAETVSIAALYAITTNYKIQEMDSIPLGSPPVDSM